MNDYAERLAVSAIRCTGQPCAISPQLEDFCSLPNIPKPMSGPASDFRLILYVGFIDPTDIAITFPADNTVQVDIRHGMKVVDETSHRLLTREAPAIVMKSHVPLVCRRDETSFFALPEKVRKSSLAAQLTQDGFLVVQSRALVTKVPGFDAKRLVPVKVCRNLDPCPSVLDLKVKAREMLAGAATLYAEVDSLCPEHSEVVDSTEVGAGVGEGKQTEPDARGRGGVPMMRRQPTLPPQEGFDRHADSRPRVQFDLLRNRTYSIGADPPVSQDSQETDGAHQDSHGSADSSKEAVSADLDPRSENESLQESRLAEPNLPLPLDSSGPIDRIEVESQSPPEEEIPVQQKDVGERNDGAEDEPSSTQDNHPSAEDQNVSIHASEPTAENQEKTVDLSAIEPEFSDQEAVSKVGSPSTMPDDKKQKDAVKIQPETPCPIEKAAKYEEPTTEEPCLEKDAQSKDDSAEVKPCIEEKGDESKEKSTGEIPSFEEKTAESKKKIPKEKPALEEVGEGESTEISTDEEPNVKMDVKNKKDSSKESVIEKNIVRKEQPTMELRKSTEELSLEKKGDANKEISAEDSSLETNVYSKEHSPEKEDSVGQDIGRKEPSPEKKSSLEKDVGSEEQFTEMESGPDKDIEKVSSSKDKSSIEKDVCSKQPSTEKETGPEKDIEKKETSAEVLVPKSSIEKDACSKQPSTEKETGPEKEIEKKETSAEVLVPKSSIEKDGSSKAHSVEEKRSLRKRVAKITEKSPAEESSLEKDTIGKQVSSKEVPSISKNGSSTTESQTALGSESESSNLDKTFTKDDLSKAHDPKKTEAKDKECPEEEKSIEDPSERRESEEKAITSERRDSEQSSRSSRRSSKDFSGTEPESSDQESLPETRSGKAKEEKPRSEKATKAVLKRGVSRLAKSSAQPSESPAKSTRSSRLRTEKEEPTTPKRAAAAAASRSLLSATKPKEESRRKKQ